MKILVIDYLSYKEHRNFNRIHIDVLIQLGHSLCLVGKKGQFDEYRNDKSVISIETVPNDADGRLNEIANLLWIKKNYNVSEFDLMVILTYDILSFFVYRISRPTILINHNNVSQLDNGIKGNTKLLLTKTLPKNYIHVCLNEEMQQQLVSLLPNRKIFHIPHGLISTSKQLKCPDFVREGERYLFCPINRNFDVGFVKDILFSMSFINALKSMNMTLYIKEKLAPNIQSDHIVKVSDTLTIEEYNYMIANAYAVLLPYGKNFRYRCSGIFFECVAQNIAILATDISAMRIYKDKCKMLLFNNDTTLTRDIYDLKEISVPEFERDLFNPYQYWQNILSRL